MKTAETEFGVFTFLDDKVVVATAKSGVEIDAKKVVEAIELIEQELPGEYGMILDRKEDYSILPVEVYSFFASRERLKGLAIVSYKFPEFLPNGMEKRIFGRAVEKFNSIELAHRWLLDLLECKIEFQGA